MIDGGKGKSAELPPITVRHDFPENWRIILLINSREKGIHGQKEYKAFKALKPFPDNLAEKLCRLVNMIILPSLIEKNFSVNTSKQSVMGHSMGGHGALLMALRLNNQFKSVSAFAPICNPMKSDWGRKQFSAYLGSNESLWENYDASVIAQKTNFSGPILIDTGSNDQFLNYPRQSQVFI